MNEQAMNEALDAISEEAEKLLELGLPERVKEKLELIHSIARYKFDLRTDAEGGSDNQWRLAKTMTAWQFSRRSSKGARAEAQTGAIQYAPTGLDR